MLTGPTVAKGLDINAEPAEVRDRYGRHTFGQSVLRGPATGRGRDAVRDGQLRPLGPPREREPDEDRGGGRKLIPPLDPAISALIDDLIARGLYEKTLVVAMGEFGRTPRMNKDGGRDHWGDAFSVLMGCGSMRMGQVIGRSNPRGEYVADRPLDPQDVAATIYHHVGIDARSITFEDKTGRPTYLIDRGEPIRELVG